MLYLFYKQHENIASFRFVFGFFFKPRINLKPYSFLFLHLSNYLQLLHIIRETKRTTAMRSQFGQDHQRLARHLAAASSSARRRRRRPQRQRRRPALHNAHSTQHAVRSQQQPQPP